MPEIMWVWNEFGQQIGRVVEAEDGFGYLAFMSLILHGETPYKTAMAIEFIGILPDAVKAGETIRKEYMKRVRQN